jgi:pyridoxamine 5'-phosphate oxidase
MTNADLPRDPIARFIEVFAAARAVDRSLSPEPTAFTLATVDADGEVSARVLLLKGVDHDGFVFYTNLESRKGRALRETGRAAMCFHWPHLETQVRVEGPITPVTDDEADQYFASRPRGSQIGAWASAQSRPLQRYEELEERVADLERQYAGAVVPRPPHWSGFRLAPSRMEFWRNMPSRLHRREQYYRDGSGWRVELLNP